MNFPIWGSAFFVPVLARYIATMRGMTTVLVRRSDRMSISGMLNLRDTAVTISAIVGALGGMAAAMSTSVAGMTVKRTNMGFGGMNGAHVNCGDGGCCSTTFAIGMGSGLPRHSLALAS